MRVRVPNQPATKWWVLLAALVATLATWCSADRVRQRRRPAEPVTVDFEVVSE